MKFWKAMAALEQGKKVKCVWWSKGHYLVDLPKGCISIGEPGSNPIAIDTTSDWEIADNQYKPQFSFSEVIKGLREGKRFRRPNWEKGAYVHQRGGSLCDENRDIGNFLLMEDFEAVDWEEVK